MPQVEPAVVAAAQAGDAAAHARLYEAFSPMVYTVARRILASQALAEDALQETFVEVLTKIQGYRGDAGLGFWVRRIAVNKCLMHLRSAWVARRSDVELPDLPSRYFSGDQVERQIALETALESLSPTARAVVWLHDVEGYTHREIAEAVGKTASFSKSQLARAHEKLRELLAVPAAEDGVELCAPELKTC
ncbi:MAG TPA: sigma-70 family RNA polymerase sigma factor [Gammaproteobacteria bacterium]|jgi:RNA polymerase sigma-70 factor (ECF subfamily)